MRHYGADRPDKGMRLRHFIWCLLILGVVMRAVADDAPGKQSLKPLLEPVFPFPSVIAAAKDAGILCEGVDEPESGSSLFPGDSVTALLTLHEKGHRYLQWLVYLQAKAETKKGGQQDEEPMVLYTSTGNKYEYASSQANLRAHVLGPFPGPGSRSKDIERQDRSVEISANEGFLSLGMEKGAAAAWRLDSICREKKITNFDFDCDFKPFDAARCDSNRLEAAACGITAEDERAIVALVPSVISYFETVEQTTNLQAFVDRVVATPSILSIAKSVVLHHGMTAIAKGDIKNVAPVSLPKSWGLASGLPVYSVPWTVTLNAKLAVVVQLIVTKPVSPFLVCGGIIGFSATNPEHPENYVTARVVSARRSPRLTESNAPSQSPHSQ
jgi:hypothetical protein